MFCYSQPTESQDCQLLQEVYLHTWYFTFPFLSIGSEMINREQLFAFLSVGVGDPYRSWLQTIQIKNSNPNPGLKDQTCITIHHYSLSTIGHTLAASPCPGICKPTVWKCLHATEGIWQIFLYHLSIFGSFSILHGYQMQACQLAQFDRETFNVKANILPLSFHWCFLSNVIVN